MWLQIDFDTGQVAQEQLFDAELLSVILNRGGHEVRSAVSHAQLELSMRCLTTTIVAVLFPSYLMWCVPCLRGYAYWTLINCLYLAHMIALDRLAVAMLEHTNCAK